MSTTQNRLLFGFVLVTATLSQTCTSLGQTSFPAPQSAAKSALDKEALQTAEAFLKRTYFKCGDSYVRHAVTSIGKGRELHWYYELKGFSWKVEGSEVIYPPLSEADRLNGVKHPVGEWKGEILVTPTVYRNYVPLSYAPGHWTSWEDNIRREPITGIKRVDPLDRWQIAKREGFWKTETSRVPPFNEYRILPVDCNALPQAPQKVSQVPDPKPSQIKNPSSPVPATVVADPLLVPPNATPLPTKRP